MITITRSEKEKEWLKKVLIESEDCSLDCHCKLNHPLCDDPVNIKTTCKRCLEENIDFEIER